MGKNSIRRGILHNSGNFLDMKKKVNSSPASLIRSAYSQGTVTYVCFAFCCVLLLKILSCKTEVIEFVLKGKAMSWNVLYE